MMMNWSERLKNKKGSQGSLFLLLIFFILFTLAHTSPRSKKTENDLVFEDGDELNLILSDPKTNRNRHVNVKTHSEKAIPWKNNGDGFNWYTNSDGNDATRRIGPQALQKRKIGTFNGESSTRKSTDYTLTDSRRRTVRVPDTDDEDLIYSGENGEGSGIETYHPHQPSGTTSRSDSGFEKHFFRISLTIGKSWSPALESSSSSIFKLYQQELEREIQNHMGFDVEGIVVNRFININDPAFVRCIFDLGLIGMTKEQVEEEFFTYNEVGSIGNLRVQREGFEVRDVGAPTELCTEGQIQCRNGKCLDISKRCDSRNDCGRDDFSDEEGCVATTTTTTTPSPPRTTSRPTTTPRPERPFPSQNASVPRCRADDQIRCGDSEIYICSDERCDSVPHCPNNWDEINCDEACPPRHFQCDFAKCVNENKRCDGFKNCNDGKDEENCKGEICNIFPISSTPK